MDRQFGIELGDPPAAATSSALSALLVPDSWPVSIMFLAPPCVDRLVADVEIRCDLRDATAGCEQAEHLPPGLRRVLPGHGERSSELLGSVIIQQPDPERAGEHQLRPTGGTSEHRV
jgi:hypothetical protein